MLLIHTSPYSVAETMNKLENLLKQKNIRVFSRISHSQAALETGMTLADEELIIFGDPKVGTYLMQESPAIGIELPLKIIAWREGDETRVGYKDPQLFIHDYHIKEHSIILEKMAGLLNMLVMDIIQ